MTVVVAGGWVTMVVVAGGWVSVMVVAGGAGGIEMITLVVVVVGVTTGGGRGAVVKAKTALHGLKLVPITALTCQ